MIKKATGLPLWFLRKFKYGGVTIPPFGIYILEERLGEERLKIHELAHWAQYQRMGLVMFYLTYFWYNIRYGYHMNPMEIEARNAETHLLG